MDKAWDGWYIDPCQDVYIGIIFGTHKGWPGLTRADIDIYAIYIMMYIHACTCTYLYIHGIYKDMHVWTNISRNQPKSSFFHLFSLLCFLFFWSLLFRRRTATSPKRTRRCVHMRAHARTWSCFDVLLKSRVSDSGQDEGLGPCGLK